MNISIVIPNYNGEKLLKQNLPVVFDALKTYKGGEKEIIIVDDKSNDDSLLTIEQFSKSTINNNLPLTILQNEKNMGFSSTVNKGVAAAHGDIVILLNTDVSPQRDFIEPLMKHFTDEKVFAVACVDKSSEKGKEVLRGRGVGEWKRGFLVHRAGSLDHYTTLWASGGSAAFRKLLWQKLGGLSPLYNPFYYEDIDLSYRALKAGYKVLFEKKSVVIHEHEKGAIKTKYSPGFIKQIAYRNQIIFVWRNATEGGILVSHLFWLPYHVLYAIARGDYAFISGLFKAFVLLPKILQSNASTQQYFIKTDTEVIQAIYE